MVGRRGNSGEVSLRCSKRIAAKRLEREKYFFQMMAKRTTLLLLCHPRVFATLKKSFRVEYLRTCNNSFLYQHADPAVVTGLGDWQAINIDNG